MILRGRIIYKGSAEGEVLKCEKPVIFLGDLNERTGDVENCGNVKDKIFVFPAGGGSTVGSYTIYGLKYYNTKPRGMILKEAEPIVAAGVIIAEIPTVDMIDISKIKNGDYVKIDGDTVRIQ